ncbi:ras-related protein Rap-2a-like [Haliotis rufescens]|uniref:ras-related protein Rap-2a-like n=1 Tax=Haliotis rufescens TaxID=6454 RepID=UPI001EAFC40F|nr:ras-related protein Rap-2a-like [Haliotis rufescens]
MPFGSKFMKLFRRMKMKSLSPSKSTSERESVLSVVVMGPPGVGKTTLAEQFMYGRLRSDPERAGLHLHQEDFQLEDQCLKLEVLDVSGAELGSSTKQRVMLQGDAFILVYSLQDKHSFKIVKDIRDEILALNKSRNVPIVIVGNKLDLKKRKRHVHRALIEAVVKSNWGHIYLEVSAKVYEDVCDVFKMVMRQLGFHFPLSSALDGRCQP